MKKSIIVAIVVVLSLAGCGQLMPTVSDAKLQAQERWNKTRGRMLCGVALEHFRVGQLDRAAEKALQAIALNGRDVEPRILLAKVYIEKARHADAAKELTTVLEMQPESAQAFYLLGVAQEKGGQPEEALASYRRAYSLDPSTLAPVRAAAEVLVAMGRIREAELYVDSYADKAQDDAALCELGGRVAMMRHEHGKAAAYYLRALDLDPQNRGYRRCLGEAQHLAGRCLEAAETLTPLTDPKAPPPSPWVQATLGDCWLAVGRAAAAREAYEKAAEQLPASAGVRAGLAKAQLAMGNARQAAAIATEALALQADCLDAALVLGYALLRDGRPDQAIRELTAAVAQHPRSGTLWCLLGRAHEAHGDRPRAVRCYQQALKAEPACRLARELLDEFGGKELSRRP